MTRGPVIAVAPHPEGFRVIATDHWRGASWPQPGDMLDPFMALHFARQAAERGGMLRLEIVPDGERKSHLGPTVEERDRFYQGGEA